MVSEMCSHTTYKGPCIRVTLFSFDRVMYKECGLVQPLLFYIQLYQVRMSVCMFQPAYLEANKNPPVSVVIVRFAFTVHQ